MIVKIFHEYDIGDLSAFIKGSQNPTDLAVYIQFKAEEFFSPSVLLSNTLIASALTKFFEFELVKDRNEFDMCIDMYEERECRTGDWYLNKVENKELIPDELLKSFLSPFYNDGCDCVGIRTPNNKIQVHFI